IKFENLPPEWNSFDLENFSKNKKLWDYQKDAIKNAVKVLWKYFENFVDYQEGEKLEINQERKRELFKWYKNNELDESLVDIKLNGKKSIYSLLTEYYSPINSKISYEHFINRMCFWMATGSGKSLVIIKLIQILLELIKRKEIPAYDILVLTHRDDLIEQLKRHVEEFNQSNETKIILKELKEYPEVKRQGSLFGNVVFYYRSDNLSDEQKEKIIDFRNYDNDGRWYVFLDEAHKGDKEDSKRQHIYSILSRNGFLFNFSATFTDPRDIITTAFEFNLSTFIQEGYGKHISILQQEMRAFKDDEDYTGEEKQKIVLKTLILLTYVKKFYEKVREVKPDLYHKPMLLVLVNSVNTEDADLKLFFREIEKIGKKDISSNVFQQAIEELWQELKNEPEFMFEDVGEAIPFGRRKLKIDKQVFENITIDEVLSYVFNAQAGGEIEVLIRPSNKKELAFKLKTSDKPFALIKIGDISGWLKEELVGYEVQESFEDESFFENLNREDSEINILMGSRGFYEGWDSNRPNVINFINIGVGEDARKFILQSVGRGVRIEPIKDKRKRLLELYNAGEIDENLFSKIKDKVLPLETLFIFGTNRNALITVIQELKKEKKKEDEHQISLFENEEAIKDKILLVPTYKKADTLSP
ncbi:MAG: DEAD/DEAH box helicase family protein, partial [Candidatus Micrarchaeia archaeon]